MSLILDALRKAETERRLGEVPRLDAQAPPVPTRRTLTEQARAQWIAGSMLALAVIAAGPIAWFAMQPAPQPTASAQPPPEAQGINLLTPKPRAALLAVESTSQDRPARPEQAPVQSFASSSTTKQRAVASDPKPAAQARLYTPETLPEKIRAQLPALVISGSIYSPRAAERIVIINGQVLREQSQVTQELSVEEILPASVVLSFKGLRFEQGL